MSPTTEVLTETVVVEVLEQVVVIEVLGEDAAVAEVIDVEADVEVVEVEVAGLPGPPGGAGPPGTGQEAVVAQRIAATILGGGRIVRSIDGAVGYADAGELEHATDVLGMTMGAALLGEPVQVLCFGPHTDPAWAWTAGEPLFLGENGLMVQEPAEVAAFDLPVGFAETPTRVFIDIGYPIYRED